MINTADLFDEGEGQEKATTSKPQYYDSSFYLDLLNCAACACRAEATRVVPGHGPKDALILFLGRNPGRDEDSSGLPFVGRGGDELDKMLDALHLDRLKIGIINIVKCHTTADRPPKPIEIQTCQGLWLPKELEFFNQAEIIFPMGREAITAVLGPKAESPARREGYWVKVSVGDRILNVCPINHPGYILRAISYQLQMYNSTLPSVKRHLEEKFKDIYERSRQTTSNT